MHDCPYCGEACEQLLDSISYAVLVVSTEGEILHVNKGAAQMFEYEKTELIGQEVEILVPEHFRAKHKELRKRFADHPRIRSFGALDKNLCGVTKSGKKLALDIMLAPARDEHGNMRVVASMVSERTQELNTLKKLQELLERATELKEENGM